MHGLSAAHRGYVYQDVATAYLLAKAIVDGTESVTVDHKEYGGDLFDDLTVRREGRVVRRQFKSSANIDKQFEVEAIKTKTSDLRIDDIVQCFLKAGSDPADEYRICTTWAVPSDEDVATLLSPRDAEPTFETYPTKLYRLNIQEIWPEDGKLRWKLRNPTPFQRQDLVTFCDRLIIELECPQITLDFSSPGPLQVLLRDFLDDRIGAGRYPNREIRPEEAAVRLTYRASLARAKQESLDPNTVLRDLGLRTDFGRVTQKFPVIPGHLVSRGDTLRELRQRVFAEKTVVLVGPPGSGKSWVLTPFAEECAKSGMLVVRHYCYLEPGDALRERRITSDVLFGNLVAELVEADPTLHAHQFPRFSAGPSELERLLRTARSKQPHRNVLLIVDGLDHVERVLVEASDVAPAEAQIVEELASLELPDGVCLLVGSQPGEHLTPLTGNAAPLQLQGWNEEETCQLARQLGTLEVVAEVFDDNEIDSYLQALHTRCGGNPLYTTYLCQETRSALQSGGAKGPMQVIEEAPPYDEHLRGYYQYLVGSEMPDVVASILAYVDFAVSEDELTEICPEVSTQLSELLTRLAPVVRDVTGQGGLRVYHESFRRFILEALAAHPVHRDAVLTKISDWLLSRGFPADARAYRYLLVYMFRRSRHQDILRLVDADFVSRSLERGYPADAILNNIGLAAKAAAAVFDWPALCRLTEVRKSIETCFQEKLDFEIYAKTLLAVDGPAALVNQLLFEGKPTRSRDEGLIACSICDDAGVTPPWREYLELDGPTGLHERQAAALADFHGRARLSTVEHITDRVSSWMQHASNAPAWYMRGVLARLASLHGADTLQTLAQSPNLPSRALLYVHLAMAEIMRDSDGPEDPAAYANKAGQFAVDVVEAFECVQLGADPTNLAAHCPDIREVTNQLRGLSYPDEQKTHEWIAAIGLSAYLDSESLVAIRDSIEIEGWYTAWLRFAISVSLAFANENENLVLREKAVCEALANIANEKSPFRGSPRACDLYSIRDEIAVVWKTAISMLQSPGALSDGLNYLSEIASSTTTYLRGSPGGPLTMDALVALGEMFLNPENVSSAIMKLIEEQTRMVETGLYEIQARLEMKLTAAYIVAGRHSEAQVRWQRACQCLCAYGFRKDITVFELVNSLPSLIDCDSNRARLCISDLHIPVESLDERTDGSETDTALVHWHEM